METKLLHVLNASAGSGKTYRLVQEYIEILINDQNDSSKYASIIAMTFTNKAALEMKERIIKALDEISYPSSFPNVDPQLKNDISSNLKISIEETEKRCKFVLQNILHNYEEFHVMTIDKFNLRLIKSFSRDLDLPADFEVVLEESEIIEKIVDHILAQLGDNNDSALNKILIKYAQSNVDEGLSWNFRRKLIEFGSVLNSERNLPFVQLLLTMNLTLEQHGELNGKRKKIDNEYLVKREELIQYINSNPINKDELPGKGHTVSDINGVIKHSKFPVKDRLIGKRLESNLDVTGTLEIKSELKSHILSLNNYWEDNIEEYVLIDLYLKNFFNMALLQYMASALNEVKKGEQIIRISEFNSLISALIQEEDAPFIYERLGNKFSHFLLDEFQDTSHLQWLNLIPLVHESLGNNNKNLIVGDPKQSIYRFKNGVAEQFIALPEIYNPHNDPSLNRKSNYFKNSGKVDELADNWRSSSVIVDFNNEFFEHFKNSMSPSAQTFYTSVSQIPKKKIAGKINIESRLGDEKAEDLIPRLIAQIDECLSDGFDPNDICILGNRNFECNTWALGLNDAGYKVVSSDSLLIHSDLHVQLSIAYLKWRYRPAGENEKKQFAELYFRIKQSSYEVYHSYIKEIKLKDERTIRIFDDEKFLLEHFNSPSSFFFKYENLYDLIQGFYRIMSYQELSNPYLHHLADIMFSYGQNSGPDLKGFLDEYERKKNKIAVQIPESKDAIQIMTMHKSKGLEFPVVIIPSIDFKLDIKGELFTEIDNKIIYKRPSKNELLGPLKELYNHERNQIMIDNINLCYVALTRPVERLYVTNYHGKDKFGKQFHTVLESMKGAQLDEETLTLNLGDDNLERKGNTDDDNQLFTPQTITEKLWFPDIALQDHDELNDEKHLSEERQFGLQFHHLISMIDDPKLIDEIVQKCVEQGEIDKSSDTELRSRLNQLFALKSYSDLFENKMEILNEQPIIVDEKTTLRPDKVIVKKDETIIIDFKTGIPNEKDKKQVREYKLVMEEIGYPNVSCYLFYSAINELRQVT